MIENLKKKIDANFNIDVIQQVIVSYDTLTVVIIKADYIKEKGLDRSIF